jgi:magnesium-transporting ATPase (P-type)
MDAGRVNIMCFDKTGTLTQDHMDVHCVRAVSGGRFEPRELKHVSDVKHQPLLWTLAGCHSVVKLSAAETVGDPLEVKMVEWTRWHVAVFDGSSSGPVIATVSSPNSNERIETFVRHEFSSMLVSGFFCQFLMIYCLCATTWPCACRANPHR